MTPQFEIGTKVLITTDNWFYAPDGKQYRSAYGTVRGIHTDEKTLGIRTNARSTNWYVQVGDLMIAGCQVHYAVRTDECHLGSTQDWKEVDGVVVDYRRPSCIYDADGGQPCA